MNFLFTAMMVAAVAIRILAACGDLWLDEIWSIEAATGAAHWWSIFTDLHSDNNHHLTSLWLRLVGAADHPVCYRSLSLAASLLTLVVLYRSPVLRNASERRFAALAGAFSFPLILYGSEARGYSIAMLASVLMLHSAVHLTEGNERDRWRRVFAVSVFTGLLGHATFLFAFVAVAAWMCTQARRMPAREVLQFLRTPILIVAVYAATVIRWMEFAGGDPATPGLLASEFLRASFGYAAVAAAMALLVLRDLRESRPEWLVLLAVLMAGPAIAASRAEYLHVRYFVIVIPFLLLFSARALGDLTRQSARGFAIAAALAAVWVYGQTVPLIELLRYGRGQSAELARYLLDTPAPSVAADHDARARAVIGYYSPPVGIEFRADGERASWLLLQRERPLEGIPPRVRTRTGQWFTFARHFPTAPLSGLHWYVYRSAEGTNTAATASSYATRYSGDFRN